MIIKRRSIVGAVLLPAGLVLPPAEEAFRWVYVLSYGADRTISKIGLATDLRRRLRRYAGRGLAYPIRFESAYRLERSRAPRVESRVHESLFAWRLWGQHDQFLVSPDMAEAALVDAIWCVVGKIAPLERLP